VNSKVHERAANRGLCLDEKTQISKEFRQKVHKSAPEKAH